MLQNVTLLAIVAIHTAANEPPKVRQVMNKIHRNVGARELPEDAGGGAEHAGGGGQGARGGGRIRLRRGDRRCAGGRHEGHRRDALGRH